MQSQNFVSTITADDAGKRLDRFLYEHIGALSRMRLRDLITAELCLVNDAPQTGGYHLRENDRVEFEFDADVETAMTPEPIPLDVVFEDDELLVVNKSAGMLVHPTKHIKTGTLANALAFHLNQEFFNAEAQRCKDAKVLQSNDEIESKIQNPKSKIVRPVLVHRLDKQTSGLMVIAKTARAGRILSDHFQRKLIEKTYLAVVTGIVEQNEGTIHAPIGRTEEKPHWRVDASGKAAESRWRVVELRPDATLLELTPITGRTNQLRIHCAHIGHPILGDEWYGGREYSRLCLHAAKLAFYHPNGAVWLEFDSPLPPEMT